MCNNVEILRVQSETYPTLAVLPIEEMFPIGVDAWSGGIVQAQVRPGRLSQPLQGREEKIVSLCEIFINQAFI